MLERAAKAAKSHLESDLGDALDTQEAYWTGQGDPIDLGDVATWLYGHNPTVVERDRADFPILTVMAMEGSPDLLASDQWGMGEERIVIIFNWFVSADDEETCNKTAQRYGEAIKAVMRDHRKLESAIELISYVPETKLSAVARELPDTGSTEFYTQMGVQTWYARARQ